MVIVSEVDVGILRPLMLCTWPILEEGRKKAELSHIVCPNSSIVHVIPQVHVLLTDHFLLMILVCSSPPPPPPPPHLGQ